MWINCIQAITTTFDRRIKKPLLMRKGMSEARSLSLLEIYEIYEDICLVMYKSLMLIFNVTDKPNLLMIYSLYTHHNKFSFCINQSNAEPNYRSLSNII